MTIAVILPPTALVLRPVEIGKTGPGCRHGDHQNWNYLVRAFNKGRVR